MRFGNCVSLLVFHAVDTSGDGRLNLEEFNRICRNPDALVYLKMLDLEVSNAEGLLAQIHDSRLQQVTSIILVPALLSSASQKGRQGPGHKREANELFDNILHGM